MIDCAEQLEFYMKRENHAGDCAYQFELKREQQVCAENLEEQQVRAEQ